MKTSGIGGGSPHTPGYAAAESLPCVKGAFGAGITVFAVMDPVVLCFFSVNIRKKHRDTI
jgi:hypothetical protein